MSNFDLFISLSNSTLFRVLICSFCSYLTIQFSYHFIFLFTYCYICINISLIRIHESRAKTMGTEYLYIQIIESIMKGIADGSLNSSSRLPTEAELSDQFGVSRITSKKALDELAKRGVIIRHRRLGSFINSQYNLATGTVDPIIENPTDSYGVSSSKKLVALVLPINTNMGDMMLYVNGVHDYITPRGYYLIIQNTNRDSYKEKELITKLVKDKVGGIIYYPFSDRHNFGLLTKLNMDSYPIVLIDKYFSGIDIPYVIPDSFAGAKMITEYLIQCGHRRIAFFSESEISEYSTVRDRFAGYCSALKEHDISINDNIIYENIIKNNDLTTEEYVQTMCDPVRNAMKAGVTAIFCPADGIALNVIAACQSININVPNDLSITGFDDLMRTSQVSVPITTVRQDLYEMGQEAAKTLIRFIEGKQVKRKVIHPVKLIVRASVSNRSADI
ncbi:MAG: GntR family transcriptional regulator [Saccharofermentanales bacterium]